MARFAAMRTGWPRTLLILTHDLLAAHLSLFIAVLLANGGRVSLSELIVLVKAAPFFIIAAAAAFLIFGLHRQVWSLTSVQELSVIAKANALGILMFAWLDLVLDHALWAPPAVLMIHWFVLTVLLSASRLLYRYARDRHGRRHIGAPARLQTSVLLYGCGPIASLFIGAVRSMPGSSVRVVGIIDQTGARRGRHLHHVPILGGLAELDRILAELAVQGIHPRHLLVAGPGHQQWARAQQAVAACHPRHALELHRLPDLMTLPTPAAEAVPSPMLSDRTYFRARRVLELVVSAAALLALAPLIGLIALAVLIDLGPPVLFRQVRPGRYMRAFTVYKFRTMGAACARDGGLRSDAERTTTVGRLLRRTRLDELPQLCNVLLGNMSFIGPRPLLPRDLPEDQLDDLAERVALRPGITGWAQVNGGHQLTAHEKLALDSWYARHAGVMVDLRILWRTLRMMIIGEEINRFELEQCTWPAQDRQRLLIVNRYFHPDESATSQLLTDLVAALDPKRFASTVLTGRETYVNSGERLPARACFAGAEVRRLRHTAFGRAMLPGRAIDYATFAGSVFLALLTTARPGDVILAKTDPPLLSVVAWLAARMTGARLVNWCQDLFPEVAAVMGMRFADGPLGNGLRWARNVSLRDAEMNVALCPGMAARLRGEGVPEGRITVIPNWADGRVIRPLPPAVNPLRHAWRLTDRFVIGYAGNLGTVHEVDSVVELMAALRDEPDLVFLFIGAGRGYVRLRCAAAERGIGNTLFQPYQPRKLLPQSLTVPDLHLVTLRPSFEGLVMPSKLYGALAAGRPVVFIGDPGGDTGEILAAGGLGLVAAPADTDRLAAAIRALRRDPARLQRMGEAARRAYDTTWNREASLAAWTRCLAAAAPQLAAARLPQPVAAE